MNPKFYLPIITIIFFSLLIFLIILKPIGFEVGMSICGALLGISITQYSNLQTSDHLRKLQNQSLLYDLRLKAHQQAYSLWRKILFADNQEEIALLVSQCQEWWDNNCLYLCPKSREAFFWAYTSKSEHFNLVRAHDKNVELIKLLHNEINKAGKILTEEMNLPYIQEKEEKLSSKVIRRSTIK
jgi:hypothetical protein